jgi:hypothetical protein
VNWGIEKLSDSDFKDRFGMSPDEVRRKVKIGPYKPKKERAEASVTAHAVTGALEGAAGIYATEPFLDKYLHGRKIKNPFKGSLKSHAKKISIGAGVGALATAPLGALVEAMRSMKKKKEPTEMAVLRLSEELIEFRKIYDIREDEDTGETSLIKIPGSSKAKAALKGGLAGGAIGAGVGAASLYTVPVAADIIGQGTKVRKFLKNRRTLAHIGAGVIAKIGADVGAIQSVSNFNERQARSKAIARAIRQARKGGTTEELSAIQKLVEFASDPYEENLNNPTLRRAYRYDSYRKKIHAHEIDRKTANITRATIYGGLVGAALPLKTPLLRRAAIGAGTGGVAQTGLTLVGGKDPYGDQPEGSKILQKRVPTVAVAAGLGTAAILRAKRIRAGIRAKMQLASLST